jgi:trafficking protein particle complex subunit 11
LNSTTVDTSVVFWTSEAVVEERVAFQFSVAAPSDIAISALPFSSLAIYFSHKEEPIMVHHNANLATSAKVQRVDLGDLSLKAATEYQGYLRWEKNAMIMFAGTVSSDVPITLAVRSHSP